MFSSEHSTDKPRFTGKWKQKSPAQDEERLQEENHRKVAYHGFYFKLKPENHMQELAPYKQTYQKT